MGYSCPNRAFKLTDSRQVPRILINKEPVGGLGSRADDVLLLGDCDEQVRRLAEACGWLEELEKLWQSVGGKVKDSSSAKAEKITHENVDDEIDKLTKEVDKSLSLSAEHDQRTREGLAKKVEEHVAGRTEDKSDAGPEVAVGVTEAKDESRSGGGGANDKSKSGDGLGHVFAHIKSNLS